MLASRSRRQRRPGPAVGMGWYSVSHPPEEHRPSRTRVVRIVISNVQRSPDADTSQQLHPGLLSVPSPRVGL